MVQTRRGRRTTFVLFAAAVLALLSFSGSHSAMAQGEAESDVGSINGIIRSLESGDPLDYANVILTRSDGAQLSGAMSLGGGRFFLRGVPAGKYVLKILYLGYKPVNETVTVVAGETSNLVFDLEVTIVKQLQEFVVEGNAIMVQVKDTEMVQRIGGEEFTDYAIDTVEDAVARQAGIVSRGGQLHVRGGRSGEISFRIDGVAVDDPLGGNSLSVGSFSVANIQTVTGGQDPEYGNALSGVVNIVTKEGGDKFEGGLRFMTDDFGRQDRTFTNFDRFEFGFGGPTPVNGLTYYFSGDMRFSDQENFNRALRPESSVEVFGATLFKFRRRQFNDFKGSSKVAWTINPNNKITAEYTASYTHQEPYRPNWDVQGYARRVLVLPEVQRGNNGFELTGRTRRAYYGPWVNEMHQNASPAVVIEERADGVVRHMAPVLEIRDIRGERVTVIAQPVFDGFRNPLSTFSTVAEDSSFVEFNSANRGEINQRFSNQLKFVYRQGLSEDTFHTIKLSRVQFKQDRSVEGDKQPYEFLHGGISSPNIFGDQTNQYLRGSDFYTDPDHPVFVTTSDYPVFQDQLSTSWTLRWDLTSNRYEGHKLKMGVQAVYNDLDQLFLSDPGRERQDQFTGLFSQGGNRNIFRTFNPEGSFYIQDRWEFEGMVVSGGFRWDMFSPGSAAQIELDAEDLDRNVFKYKHQFSPRLGIAFPITDRDGFHFHYGRFVQFPDRNVLFASQDPIGTIGTLGNPDLEAETTISYQAGVRRQFNDYLAGQFAVYNKDIFGLIAATQVTDERTAQTRSRFINKAFANARGIELTLEKRFHERWGFDLAYTYAFADGVASSQTFGANPDGLKFLPNQELPLDWDQRHSLNMSLRVAEPSEWAASLVFSYGSGFPWTPSFRFERRADPLLENSQRLPAEYSLDVQAERHVNLYGQQLTLLFQAFNLINQDVVAVISPGLFPGTIDATPSYAEYLTETGKFGGAYLQDVDGDNRDDFVPLNDPRVFQQHRLFRVGVRWQF